jgi:hypothetical protein
MTVSIVLLFVVGVSQGTLLIVRKRESATDVLYQTDEPQTFLKCLRFREFNSEVLLVERLELCDMFIREQHN